MSSESDEIDIKDIHGNVRLYASNRLYRNAAGVGLLWKPPGTNETFSADFSALKFRRVDFMRANFSLDFEAEVLVDIDTIDTVIDQLASMTGNSQFLIVGEAERKAVKSHVDDLRNITGDLLEMQRAIINRVTRRESGV